MVRGTHSLGLACLVAAVASAQQPAPSSVPNSTVAIQGRVSAENDAALPRARLTLGRGDRPSVSVLSNDDGRFAMPIPADWSDPTFTMQVAKAGFATTTIRVPRAEIAGGRELRLQLPRGAAVYGDVVDRSGQPVVYALVLVRSVQPDSTIAASRMLGETDDRGYFRTGGLPAGRYEVTLVGEPSPQREPLSRIEERLFQDRLAPLPWKEVGTPVLVDLRAGDEAVVNLVSTMAVAAPPEQALDRLPPGQTGTASISGHVMTSGGRPLAFAEVRAMQSGTAGRFSATDAQGRFAIRELPAGAFTLEARKPGYVTLQYGQQRSSERGKTVTLREGETIERIDFVLPGGSTITGTVVDDHGEPLAGITVRALELRTAGDLTLAGSARGVRERRTDDRGHYRLFGLLPGRYLVTASLDAEMGAASTEANGYAPTFYPATNQISLAQPIPIEIGREAAGIDLVFTRSRTARVTGFAVDAAGQPLQTGVLLFESQRSASIMQEPRKAALAPDGAFAFANVPPGEYVVQIFGAPSGVREPPRPSAGTPTVWFGMHYVTVADVDPAPITVRLSPGATVEGRIVKNGIEEPGATRFSVWPFPTDFDRSPIIGSGAAGVTMNEDGTFRVRGVTGSRRFVLRSAPRGWYLESATINGLDAADTPFDFGLEERTFADVEIVLSGAGASIAGRVADDQDAAVRDYAVIAFSTDRAKWFRNSARLKIGGPDQDGRFEIDGLPPGEYWLVAVDRLEGTPAAGEWQDRTVLEDLSRRAVRVTLGPSQAQTMDLRLNRR